MHGAEVHPPLECRVNMESDQPGGSGKAAWGSGLGRGLRTNIPSLEGRAFVGGWCVQKDQDGRDLDVFKRKEESHGVDLRE